MVEQATNQQVRYCSHKIEASQCTQLITTQEEQDISDIKCKTKYEIKIKYNVNVHQFSILCDDNGYDC